MITSAIKRMATVKARLALAGFAVVDGSEGGWNICRWDRTRFCSSLEGLEAFAERVGVL
ncbi:MAG: hypothetical protein Q7V09_15010 [Hydrogenophaga sp.]|uniref:hypothetical protein n=1 Tax=Hydrogenophaga sp. TaxID=1904254 RepID=UPI00271B8087|nr:hypothetical protein [Hydrogenophaga sp.]MDO9031741.1 hypothetical protein [Hydrogenophaga sp.]